LPRGGQLVGASDRSDAEIDVWTCIGGGNQHSIL
jgi:hypothetical protein